MLSVVNSQTSQRYGGPSSSCAQHARSTDSHIHRVTELQRLRAWGSGAASRHLSISSSGTGALAGNYHRCCGLLGTRRAPATALWSAGSWRIAQIKPPNLREARRAPRTLVPHHITLWSSWSGLALKAGAVFACPLTRQHIHNAERNVPAGAVLLGPAQHVRQTLRGQSAQCDQRQTACKAPPALHSCQSSACRGRGEECTCQRAAGCSTSHTQAIHHKARRALRRQPHRPIALPAYHASRTAQVPDMTYGFVGQNQAFLRALPLYAGGFGIVSVLLNRAVSGVGSPCAHSIVAAQHSLANGSRGLDGPVSGALQVSAVVDASSSQSRADVLGIIISAVLLLTGLQWLSLKPRQQEAVRVCTGCQKQPSPHQQAPSHRRHSLLSDLAQQATRHTGSRAHYLSQQHSPHPAASIHRHSRPRQVSVPAAVLLHGTSVSEQSA